MKQLLIVIKRWNIQVKQEREGRGESVRGERDREKEREREREVERDSETESISIILYIWWFYPYPYDPNKRNTFDPSATSAVTYSSYDKFQDLGWIFTKRGVYYTILPVVLTVTCPASRVCESWEHSLISTLCACVSGKGKKGSSKFPHVPYFF